jgi:hypothetical protein
MKSLAVPMPDLDALLTEAEAAHAKAKAAIDARSPMATPMMLLVAGYVPQIVAALRTVRVPVTEEWLEGRVLSALDDESHEDVCACGDWPESCVTYGIRRPWSHDASRAIEYIARNFTVLPSPGTTTEEE